MDLEGRNLRVDFDNVSVMSMYLPSGTNQARLDFKFNYMKQIQDYLINLKKEIPKLIVCGDYNICHKAIDIHNPKMKGVSGFLPEEREWIGNFIDNGFIDSFRHLNKEPHHYSWWSYRANSRSNNKGWRIDYNMVSLPLKDAISRAFILPDAKHSDHCPIGVELQF
jgi:exodeoxyribonuclease-3